MMMHWLQAGLKTLLILTVVLLTGCIQYDLNFQFDSQTHGQWVQQLHWRGGGVAPDGTVAGWLGDLSDRTQAIGGNLQFLGSNGFEIVVPFNNGAELEAKFNQFFHSAAAEAPFTLPNGEPIRAALTLRQGNWLLAIHNDLSLQIDLTAVPDLTDTVLPLLQGAQLLEGKMRLLAPWGVRSPAWDWQPEGHWTLTAGEINTIEAEFWVPSPIGIGAAAIALLMLLGYAIKYGLMRQSVP